MQGPCIVLATGPSSGTGGATARLAAQRGDHLALMGLATGPLDRVSADCEALGAASTTTFSAGRPLRVVAAVLRGRQGSLR